MAAPFAAAWGIVIHKQHVSRENIVVASNVQMIFGGIPLALGAVIFESWTDFHMTPLIIVGTVLILSGIFLVLKKQQPQPAES